MSDQTLTDPLGLSMTETTSALIQGFENYRTAYTHIHPPPPALERVRFDLRQVGLALFFILCLTIYAATRTAAVIIETEIASGYAANTAAGLSWVAVIGIEGMLLFMAITHTRKEHLYAQEHAWILIVLGGFISALAGISSGFGLLDESAWLVKAVGGVNFVLALFLGIGATVMVWASGEFVGTAMHNHRIQQLQRERAYRQELSAYEAGIRAAWEGSDERQLLMHAVEVARARQQAELDILQKQADYSLRYANTRREKGQDLLGLNPQVGEKLSSASHFPPPASHLSQSDLGYEYLTRHPERKTWRALEDLPTARDMQAALRQWYYEATGEEKEFSTGSLTRARERYAKERLNGHG